MPFDAGNLITLALVAIILVIYRLLDRDNRSLEKVKKYAERMKEELHAFTEQRRGDLRDYAIELDVHQKAAKEVLARVQAIEDGLNARADAIDSIGARVREYDGILDELLGMTERAEENLRRIREESEFADTVAKKLKDAEAKLEKVISTLPAIQSDFQRRNQEGFQSALTELSAGLRKDLSQAQEDAALAMRRAQQARDEVQSLDRERGERAKEDLQALESVFERAFERARKEAERLEGQAFQGLKDSIQGRAGRLQETLEEKYQGLQAKARDQITETQELIQRHKAEYQDALAGLDQALSQSRLALEDFKASQADQLLGHQASLRSSLDALNVIMDGSLSEAQGQLAEFQARQSGELVERQAAFQASVDGLRLVVESAIAEARQDCQDGLSQLRQTLETRAAGMESECIQTISQVGERLSQANDQASLSWNGALAQAEAARQERLKELERLGEESFRDQSAKIGRRAQEGQEELLARIEAQRVQILGQLDAADSEAREKIRTLEDLGLDIDRLESELRQAMDGLRLGVEGDFGRLAQAMRQRQGEQEEALSGGMAKLQASMEELESGLSELKATAYQNVSERLQGFEEGFFADLEARRLSTDAHLAEWKAQLDDGLARVSETELAERRRQEAAQEAGLRRQAEEAQQWLNDQISRLELNFSSHRESLDQRIEASDKAINEFTAESQRALEAAKAASLSQADAILARHGLEVSERLTKAERELEAFREGELRLRVQLAEDWKREKESIDAELGQAEASMEGLRAELSRHSAQALANLKTSYESMVSQAEESSRELSTQAERRLAEFRRLVAELSAKTEEAEAKVMEKLQADGQALGLRLAALEERERDFVAQTRAFERADELRQSLERNVEDLKAELSKAHTYRGDLAELESQMDKIKRMDEDIAQRLTRFSTERRRIETMEEDFRRLLSVSESVDARLARLTDTSDLLTEMDARMRSFSEACREADEKHERLEKKAIVLDSAAEGIDRAFRGLGELESRLQAQGQELGAMPPRIEEIGAAVGQLNREYAKISAAVDALGSLEADLSDIEARMASLRQAREWLAGTETRLQDLARDAEDQVKLFGQIVKNQGSQAKREEGAPPESTRDMAIKLAQQGWNAEQIARATRLSRGEIELILEMGNKR